MPLRTRSLLRFCGLFCFLLVLAAVPFWRVLSDSQLALLYRDAGADLLVTRSLWAEAWREGAWPPFWNHFIRGGTPLLASSAQQILHPLNFLFAFVSSGEYPRGIVYFIYLHYVALVAGFFLLARHFRLSYGAALLFAIMGGSSGLAISAHVITPLMGNLAVLPWYFLALLRARRDPSLARLFFLSAVIALPVYVGDPHCTLVMGFFTAATLLSTSRRAWWPRMKSLMVCGVLSLLAAAPQLFPALELARLGGRLRNELPFLQAVAWSFDPRRVAEFFLPNFFGTVFPDFHYWGFAPERQPGNLPYFLNVYCGVFAFFLLCTGLFLLRRNRNARLLLIPFVLLFLLSCGDLVALPVFAFFRDFVPGFGFARFPARFLLWPYLLLHLLLLGIFRRQKLLLRIASAKKISTATSATSAVKNRFAFNFRSARNL